jgi:hypothetical protein
VSRDGLGEKGKRGRVWRWWRAKASEFWQDFKWVMALSLEALYWMLGLSPFLFGLLLWFGEHRFYEVTDIPWLVVYYVVWLVIFRFLPTWPFRRSGSPGSHRRGGGP